MEASIHFHKGIFKVFFKSISSFASAFLQRDQVKSWSLASLLDGLYCVTHYIAFCWKHFLYLVLHCREPVEEYFDLDFLPRWTLYNCSNVGKDFNKLENTVDKLLKIEKNSS